MLEPGRPRVRLTVSVTAQTIAAIDCLRGGKSRGDYLSHLVGQFYAPEPVLVISGDDPAAVDTAKAVKNAPTMPEMAPQAPNVDYKAQAEDAPKKAPLVAANGRISNLG